jgi:OmpA-OmpF porin, OOP family
MKRLFMICAMLAVAACAQQPPPAPVAATPPPPPPPPPPPMTYTVYFDYNSSQLGPTGIQVVELAANGYKAGTPSSVQVTGYASPPGTAGFNQRLSLRRANAVAAQLQQDGVPQSALVVSGQGETTNSPTPGQDQRVDIVIGGGPPAAPSS